MLLFGLDASEDHCEASKPMEILIAATWSTLHRCGVVFFSTLWLFNIAMENGGKWPIEIDDFPIKTSIYYTNETIKTHFPSLFLCS